MGAEPGLDFKEHPIIISLEELRSQQYEIGRHELSDHNRVAMPHMDSHPIPAKASCGLLNLKAPWDLARLADNLLRNFKEF